MKTNNKVLCFTNSYNRPYHIYNTIQNILHQTYHNFDYVIGISIDDPQEEESYNKLIEHSLTDIRVKVFFHPNLNQHDNYLYPILQTDYKKYNIFVKIDDDDIYKPDYLAKSLAAFTKYKCDIISSNTKYQINNHKIYTGKFDNVAGHWHQDLKSAIKFGMPFSYIFNRRCLNILLQTTSQELCAIHPFEDAGWRTKWRENNIKSHVIQNSEDLIYHIHGHNISSTSCLIPNGNYVLMQNDLFMIAYFMNTYWQSYLFLNKRTSQAFNINNNDYGTFNSEHNTISIKWNNYNHIETFELSGINQSQFYKQIS